MGNYLYGLTVQGIQSYIFETNKLREIVGGSEIVEQICTTWFKAFVEDKDKNIKGNFYQKAAGNIRFETKDENSAKTIYNEYHKFLLENSPGVPFSQAVVEINENVTENQAIDELDAKLRAQRNQPLYAFDLGLMARGKNRRTGNPEFTEYNNDDAEYPDIITYAKQKNKGATALQDKTKIEGITYPTEFSEIAKGSTKSWLALIHIDGNGMGNRINDIRKGKGILETLKGFSENVEKSTIAAYQKGVDIIQDILKQKGNVTLPMRPIVLGGDDVTLIIRGDLAMAFTYAYLEEFEKQTEENLKDYGGKLTAAAGIAFVKEKFPFHYSAHIAEELTSFAKNKSERKHSCLHFHMVQDSFVDSYKDIIIKDLTTKDNFMFINGPYYLNKPKAQSISGLLSDIEKLKSEDAPTNAMREWVDVKFNNSFMADTIMGRIKRKYGEKYQDIIKNTKAYIDYHTLLSVGIKY